MAPVYRSAPDGAIKRPGGRPPRLLDRLRFALRQALRLSNRTGLCRLGATLHPASRQAPSAGNGRAGNRSFLDASGGHRPGLGEHANPGAARFCSCTSTSCKSSCRISMRCGRSVRSGCPWSSARRSATPARRAFVRDPPARIGQRHSDRPGTAGPPRRVDDDDLHACARARRLWGAESTRRPEVGGELDPSAGRRQRLRHGAKRTRRPPAWESSKGTVHSDGKERDWERKRG